MIRGYYRGKNAGNMYLCTAHGKWVTRTATMLAFPLVEKISAEALELEEAVREESVDIM